MLRPMNLAMSGWYPNSNDACRKEIEKLIDQNVFIEGKVPVSAVVPHAGWYFCGQMSVNCIRVLKEKNGTIDNVFIFGGHLSEVNLAVVETF
jgi:AmmeMemoRadiSam system protein B